MSQQTIRQLPPDEVDAMLAAATIALQLSQAQRSRGDRTQAVTESGLKATSGHSRPRRIYRELALQRSPSFELAERQRGRRSSSPVCGTGGVRAGMAGNPLLMRKYGKLIEELEQRLGSGQARRRCASWRCSHRTCWSGCRDGRFRNIRLAVREHGTLRAGQLASCSGSFAEAAGPSCGIQTGSRTSHRFHPRTPPSWRTSGWCPDECRRAILT